MGIKKDFIDLPIKERISISLGGGVFLTWGAWMMYLWFVRDSDLYQRNFNTAKWEIRQQERAARSERNEYLNKIECQVMLRAKMELAPIEFERRTLHGMSGDNAKKSVEREIEMDKKLCDEYGISPVDTHNDERAPHASCYDNKGVYTCDE